jgi:FAD/FMN-containing dehydrogenase
MDTTHTVPLPFDEPSAAVEQITPITTAPGAPALIWPDSDEYDTARLAFNLAADQRPACVCVATVQDVQAAIDYARNAGLTVAPQGTGHLGQALPSLERTMLLKTALYDGEVEVDPVKRTARIKAGTAGRGAARGRRTEGAPGARGSPTPAPRRSS